MHLRARLVFVEVVINYISVWASCTRLTYLDHVWFLIWHVFRCRCRSGSARSLATSYLNNTSSDEEEFITPEAKRGKKQYTTRVINTMP